MHKKSFRTVKRATLIDHLSPPTIAGPLHDFVPKKSNTNLLVLYPPTKYKYLQRNPSTLK